MADFNIALAKILKHEGGYVNDPSDKGGETYKGISRKYHSKSQMWIIIDKYKHDCGGVTAEFKKKINNDATISKEVALIYKSDYWNPFNLDAVKNQKIAEQIFDDAVNRGVGAACKLCCALLGLPITTKPTNKLLLSLEML